MSEEKQRVVKREGMKPCGCYITEFSDNTVDHKPCLACGLVILAGHLQNAANAAGATGQHLAEMQKQAQLQAAVAEATKGPKGIIKP